MWTGLLPTLLLLQSIVVQAQSPPIPKSVNFTQIICDGGTGSRNNQIELFDGDGEPLGAVNENCSLGSGTCKVEGLSDITVGPYTVNHPEAFFGPCTYKNTQIEITATDGEDVIVKQQLFATCKSSKTLCEDDSGIPTGQLNEVIISEFSSTFKPTSIGLRGYNTNGCPAGQNVVKQISNTECTQIISTGITTVVVVPKLDMPSTCVLTLYSDTACFSTSNASIGPITPSSNPSVCIGPIRNLAGDLFEAKSAILIC
ncbi:hypothetical protein B9Z19DRAFT_1069011 [Tuber borchii]|uniref:Secreted protein n=1 Tax=Tuber borchii TaxID=42251 RepID=A0A2T6ZD59_TUBBO|nr:hypothetical protein B9Z19DRAFT_1069011 [Tuber borchii]